MGLRYGDRWLESSIYVVSGLPRTISLERGASQLPVDRNFIVRSPYGQVYVQVMLDSWSSTCAIVSTDGEWNMTGRSQGLVNRTEDHCILGR